MNVKEDRRIRITKKAIKESLIELLQEHPISKISVKLLCETADINRSTFYAHYTDQYDLLKKVQQETISGIRLHIMNKSFLEEQNRIAVPVLIQILEYAKENRTLFKVLLSDNSDGSFKNELILLANEKSVEEARETRQQDATETKYLTIFALGGVISILNEWLNGDCLESPEKLAELVSKLLFQGIISLYQ